MRFFVDTAKVGDTEKANSMGIIYGVTTNPSLVIREGHDFKEVIKEVAEIVDGPISGEVKVTAAGAEDMMREGRKIVVTHPNMAVKIPMTVEGLKTTKVLTVEGIEANVTLTFSASQTLLVTRVGTTYISPFLGRLDNISQNGVDLIRMIVKMFEIGGVETEIIAVSIRNPIRAIGRVLAGADVATMPYNILGQMTKHSLIDQGIVRFQTDYETVFEE